MLNKVLWLKKTVAHGTKCVGRLHISVVKTGVPAFHTAVNKYLTRAGGGGRKKGFSLAHGMRQRAVWSRKHSSRSVQRNPQLGSREMNDDAKSDPRLWDGTASFQDFPPPLILSGKVLTHTQR